MAKKRQPSRRERLPKRSHKAQKQVGLFLRNMWEKLEETGEVTKTISEDGPVTMDDIILFLESKDRNVKKNTNGELRIGWLIKRPTIQVKLVYN